MTFSKIKNRAIIIFAFKTHKEVFHVSNSFEVFLFMVHTVLKITASPVVLLIVSQGETYTEKTCIPMHKVLTM
jgi:hypothetical protein